MTVVFGNHDQKTLDQFAEAAKDASHAVLCADGHYGYEVPVGGVVAYEDKIPVCAVGYDIACGNCAIKTDINIGQLGTADEQHKELVRLADEINSTISFGIGQKNTVTDAPREHAIFEDKRWSLYKGDWLSLRDKARNQLGTVGGGNHYVDVFKDETDTLWVGVHFGSRGFGHTVATAFMVAGAMGKPATYKNILLDANSNLGIDYWELMSLAGEYAYAGREWVTRKVVSILGGKEVEMVHNHHNFSWKETHFGKQYYVGRKGATPAFPGQYGFVGGSMGDNAVIIKGSSDPASKTSREGALFSTVHGAGRVMSRTEAAGKFRKGTRIKPGKVTRQMMSEWTKKKGVIVRGGGVDESPHVYRRLNEVLDCHKDTIDIVHTLTPLIAVMASDTENDPYKD